MTEPAFPHDLDLHGTTDRDVAEAILFNRPFPARPGDTIELGHIGFSTGTGSPVDFTVAGAAVSAEFSAGVAASAGVFKDAKSALTSLNLGETPGLRLTVPSRADTRFALVCASYNAKGSVSGTHPLGAVGTLKIGVAADTAGVLAVLHRFRVVDGARDVFAATLGNWMLPRRVESADALKPETWVIGEVDGSLAVKVAATLGYNVDFIRTVKAGTLSGDIGVKVDAALKATFGLDVSGRYVVVVGREAGDSRVRVQLFKLSRKGITFGLNLKVGVTGVETLTQDPVDDFIAAVFGVHGTQFVDALRRLDEWTVPEKSIGEFVAGLANEGAQALFLELTGKSLKDEFEAARAPVVQAIHQWESLPAKVSAELWALVGTLDASAEHVLNESLALLTESDDDAQKKAFDSLLRDTRLSPSSALARLLNAAADHGLLDLIDRPSVVRTVATNVKAILDGGVIKKLQKYVEKKLGLAQVLKAIKQEDFDTLDTWLVARLGRFFDTTLKFEDLDSVRAAIHLALAQRKKISESVQKALNSRYGLELAATWQRTTADTAVFDVEFDTSVPAGRELLASLLQQADFDRILVETSPAVQIRTGVLSHEVTRKTTVNLTLPHVNLRTQTINEAFARVEVDASGPGVLAYEATGKDVVDAKNRFRSSLSVGIAAAVAAKGGGDVRVHSLDGTWSYELLLAQPAMRRAAFEATTRPFIEKFMLSQFRDATALRDWYRLFDDSIEARLHNGPDVFGDVCAAYEVTVPSVALAGWFRPAADVQSSAKAISVAVQGALKDVVSFYYLTDTGRLGTLVSSAALLTWASIPPENALGGNDVMWDSRDRAQLDVMTGRATMQVVARLRSLRDRLEEAGMHDTVQFYADEQAPIIVATARAAGKDLLNHLLSFELAVVRKATDAYKEAQDFVRSEKPSVALERLAAFAGDITEAFNTLAGDAVFVSPAFRPIAQSVFVEAARALDRAAVGRPSAMLTLSVLNPVRTFDIATFPAGKLPPHGEIAIGQRLVAL